MSNELKVGDVVMINGEEFKLLPLADPPSDHHYCLKRVLQKSELEKFVDERWAGFEIDEKVSVRTAKNDADKTALALLEYLERRAEEFNHSLGMTRAVTIVREWCGK